MIKRLPSISTLLPVLLVWLWYPANASAQAQGGSIVGQVRIVRGSFPNTPILVTLGGRGAIINSIYTDNEGRFGFNNLPGNIYHVSIQDKDYQPVNETVSINPNTNPVAYLTILLAPIETKENKLGSNISGGSSTLANEAEFTKRAPKAAKRKFERGVKCEGAGKSDEAIEHYRKAVEIYPDFYAARNNLGSALLSKAQYGEAQQQFERVVALNATDAASYFNLANLYIITKQAEPAQIWIERGLARQPDSGLGHFLQGSLYELTGRFKEAETSLRRSIELDPLMAKAHLALVNLYLQTKRDEQAVSELRAFLTAFPNDPFAPKAKQVLKRLEGGPAVSDPLTR